MRTQRPDRSSASQPEDNERQHEKIQSSVIRGFGRWLVNKVSSPGSTNNQDNVQAASFSEESKIEDRSLSVAQESHQGVVSTNSGDALKSQKRHWNDDSATEPVHLKDGKTEPSTVTENSFGHQPSILADALKVGPLSTFPNSYEDLEKLTQLLDEMGLDGSAGYKEGMHPLHFLENCDAQQLINLKNNDQNNLIHLAAMAGHFDLLKWLLDQCGAQLLLEKGDGGYTPLHFAVWEGHRDIAEYIMKACPESQSQVNNADQNVLHIAALKGRSELLEYLVKQGSPEDLRATDKGLETPLHIAAKKGHDQCVAELLKPGKGLQNLKNKDGNTAAHLAAFNGHREVLKRLYEQGGSAPLTEKGPGGYTPLHFAAHGGHRGTVEYIMKACPESQSQVNNADQNVLHIAALKGRSELLGYLVKQGSAEDLRATDKGLETPLHIAAKKGHDQCVAELLESGKGLQNLKNKQGNTAAHLAAFNGHREVLKQLYEQGGSAVLTEKGQRGFTPLHFAAHGGHRGTVEYIMKARLGSQSAVNDDDQNALHIAASNGHGELLRYLVAQSSAEDLRATDKGLETPLHIAAMKGHDQCVAELLKPGKGLQNLKNKQGNTAAHLAALNGHREVLKRLYEQGGSAPLTEKGPGGYTPLHFAAHGGHRGTVEYIMKACPGSQSQVNNADQNVLHIAALKGRSELLGYLVKQGSAEDLRATDKGLETPLHIAAKKGHDQCVAELLESGKGLQNLKNKQGNTAAHLAAFNGHREVLKQLYEQGGSAVLTEKGQRGFTPLHFAAHGGHRGTVEYIMKARLGSQSAVNDDDQNALHIAASNGHGELLRYLVAQSSAEDLRATDKENSTPLHLSVFRGYLEITKELLSHETIKEELSRIDLFGNLFSENAEVAKLLADTRKKYGVKRISWSMADSNHSIQQRKRNNEFDERPFVDSNESPEKRRRIGQADEWPMMSEKKGNLSSLVSPAASVLSSIPSVGLFLFNPVYPIETKDKFWSMGDLNAGVQMAKVLEGMGAKSLDVVLSPPDDSPWSQRSTYQKSKKRKYKVQQEIARYKLARLWPAFDPEKPLPQTVKMGNCHVTFRDCDDQSLTLPPVMFSFLGPEHIYQRVTVLPDTIITLKPYRFGVWNQKITTDIQENRGNVFPLSLPANSRVPEVKGDSQHIERSSLLSTEPINNPPLEKVINRINERSRSGNLDLGIVYGLHHSKLSNDSKGKILNRWVSNITAYTKKSTNKKPAMIAVASSAKLESTLKNYAELAQLPLIDLSTVVQATDEHQKAVAAQTVIDQIDQLSSGKPAICILPSLPKHQFDELVLSSRLPTLAEGANLTSFLLQHGHPHLSLLPSGETPVAQDMGDPFEAMKAQAFSYKLGVNQDERNILKSLASLVKDRSSKSYEKAIRQIKGLDKNKVPNLAFLWQSPQQSTFLELEQLTVMKLLEKGKAGTLGETGEKVLLSVLDPSSQKLEQYTRDAMDEDSATARHFELQKMHVNGPSLNAVSSALVQLGKYKGVI